MSSSVYTFLGKVVMKVKSPGRSAAFMLTYNRTAAKGSCALKVLVKGVPLGSRIYK